MGTDPPDCSRSQIALLHRVSSIVSPSLGLDEMLALLVGVVVGATGSDAWLVYLLEPDTGETVLRASQPPRTAEMGRPRFLLSEGVTGYQAFRSVPLVSHGAAVGVIEIRRKKPHEYTPEEIDLLVFIGEQAGAAVARARLGEGSVRPREALPGGKGSSGRCLTRQDRFDLAVAENIHRAVQQCDYEPETYLLLVCRYGGLQAAKRLLADPVSDDSLQLWARGIGDLAIEALARSEEWKGLFSAEERLVAGRRCAEWLSAPAAGELVAQVLTESVNPLLLEPENDVAWCE